jgi:hypothetical protein
MRWHMVGGYACVSRVIPPPIADIVLCIHPDSSTLVTPPPWTRVLARLDDLFNLSRLLCAEKLACLPS